MPIHLAEVAAAIGAAGPEAWALLGLLALGGAALMRLALKERQRERGGRHVAQPGWRPRRYLQP